MLGINVIDSPGFLRIVDRPGAQLSGQGWRGPLSSYVPDIAALRASPVRVVAGVGASSVGQLAHRCGSRWPNGWAATR
jgi:hypothetical protein